MVTVQLNAALVIMVVGLAMWTATAFGMYAWIDSRSDSRAKAAARWGMRVVAATTMMPLNTSGTNIIEVQIVPTWHHRGHTHTSYDAPAVTIATIDMTAPDWQQHMEIAEYAAIERAAHLNAMPGATLTSTS